MALAALIVLALRPEALLGPGFQMSFAATVALVAVFGALRDLGHERAVPGWARGAMSLLVSSLTASLATGPIAMVHFNLLSQYGLLANLVSVPVMGLLIMPMAVMAALLMPLGLDWIAFAVMAPGLDWILAVAQEVAGWQGASRQVVAPGPLVLPLLAAGGLMLALWQGHGRWTGLAPLLLAALLWSQTARPDLLIADTGGKAAVAAGVTADLTDRISAVDLVKAAVEALGGKGGGGRPDLAQGGAKDTENAEAAIAAAEALIGA